jgi:hypothetical protein
MAAMKPRTGDGPLEVTKEGRGIVMRVPLEGGGRLVVEITADEASALGDARKAVVSLCFLHRPGEGVGQTPRPGGAVFRAGSILAVQGPCPATSTRAARQRPRSVPS